MSVQCKFHDQALCKAASEHPTWAKFLQQGGTYIPPFKAPSPFQSDWWCPLLIQFFFLFFSSQPPRLIPANCRNFFRRLQPMSSELTPMVRKMKGFPVRSVLPCAADDSCAWARPLAAPLVRGQILMQLFCCCISRAAAYVQYTAPYKM